MADKLVLIEDQVFLVSDEIGDIPFGNNFGLGLYYMDTRFLSVFDFTINGAKPVLLSSSAEQNFMGHLQMANPTWLTCQGETVKAHTVSIRRNRFIGRGLEERIGLFNYNPFPVEVEAVLVLAADFKDMFQVRGLTHEPHGTILPPSQGHAPKPEQGDSTISLNYIGLDDVKRRTDIVFETPPTQVEILKGGEVATSTLTSACATQLVTTETNPPGVKATFRVTLEPGKPYSITMYVTPAITDERPHRSTFDVKVRELRESYESWFQDCTSLETDNEIFNRFLWRGQNDLRALLSKRPTGLFPAAGIPWYTTPFGRDGLITALQTLMLNPEIAVGTLRFLASHQGKEIDGWREEQPGKIMHEIRLGEMSRRGAIPHTPYYGSIDATPLFLILFAETISWLDDDALYQELLPAVKAALAWIDAYGDLDGDGFVEYRRSTPSGLLNQVWKDSVDSYAYASGEIAEPPIASVEVQGYVYDAKARLAELFERKGELDLARRLRNDAEILRDRFAAAFWMEQQSFLAQGLDARKRQLPAITSQPGHCLWSGIVRTEHARIIADRLLASDMFSGWGVRTLSSHSPNFNPLSYHNGSVWPHDNAIVAAGLKKYGFDDHANEVISAIFMAGARFRYSRLPELFSGFDRDLRYFSIPAEYPVSCSPQAWAAGAPILFLQTILGLRADAGARKLYVRPTLPDWLDQVAARNLRIGDARVDILASRHSVQVAKQSGSVDVVVEGQADMFAAEWINRSALDLSAPGRSSHKETIGRPAATSMRKMAFFV